MLKMKTYISVLVTALLISINTVNATDIYEFKVEDISGKEFDISSLKGKKVMIVNTASKCGLTPQYEDLQALYTLYKDQDFVIVGFPANNFMKQEPGNDGEIETFCKKNYGVTFPMMSKISVKGEDIHPLYAYLTRTTDSKVRWNFQKYLINADGSIAGVISPREKPNSSRIVDWIETGKLEEK